jgi:hypothetical protein
MLTTREGEKASGTLKKALVGMNEVLNVMRMNGRIGSVSSQDSSRAESERGKEYRQKLLEAFHYMHTIKAIKSAVVAKTILAEREEVQREFYKYCRTCNIARLDEVGLDRAVDLFSKMLVNEDHLTIKRLIELLVKVEDYANPRKAEEREAQGRREEKARADAQLQVKDKQLEVKDKQLEVKDKQLKAKDAEIERLKRAAERGVQQKFFSNDSKNLNKEGSLGERASDSFDAPDSPRAKVVRKK